MYYQSVVAYQISNVELKSKRLFSANLATVYRCFILFIISESGLYLLATTDDKLKYYSLSLD